MGVPNEILFKCDITELPCVLVSGERLKSLKGLFKISFNEESVPHVRCHSLTKSDEQDLLQFIDLFEQITSTVAVLFINFSDEIMLDEYFRDRLPSNFPVNIPVYSTSSTNGQSIKQVIDQSSGNCQCYFMFDPNDDQLIDYQPNDDQTNDWSGKL